MTVELAIQLVLSLIDRASAISQMIQAAKAAGQTTLTADQWSQILNADDAARQVLVDAIAARNAAPTGSGG